MSKAEAQHSFALIAHGDADHRAWLLEAPLNFANGEPVPPPRGEGTK